MIDERMSGEQRRGKGRIFKVFQYIIKCADAIDIFIINCIDNIGTVIIFYEPKAFETSAFSSFLKIL